MEGCRVSWMVYDYPDPPPGWQDAEYPTPEDEDEIYYEKADRWDDPED